MKLLANKTVVITGGAGLIGSSFCSACLNQGAHVIVADNDQHRMDVMYANFQNKEALSKLTFVKLNVTSKQSINSLIKRVHSEVGQIDALVNNAYPRNKNYGRKFEEVEYADFCENMSLHAGGYFLTAQQFSLYFSEHGGGNIINMASIYGKIAPRFHIYDATGMTMPIEYAAIKAAVVQLTFYMAQYLKGKNIRVNCISPGGILDRQPQSFLNAYNSMAASKGMLSPQDVTGTLVYLLSDLSKYVNGQNIFVDDGWSL